MSQPTPSGNPVRASGFDEPFMAPTVTFSEGSDDRQVHVAMRTTDGARTHSVQGWFDRDQIADALERTQAPSQRVMEPAA